MKTLIKFELRKILTKRSTVIALTMVLSLSLLLSFSSYHNQYAFDGDSTQGSGMAAVEIDQQIASKYQGPLTDEKVQNILKDFKPSGTLNGLNAKYIYMNALQSATFYHFSDLEANWNGMSVSDVFGDEIINIGYINGWLISSQNFAKIFMLLSLVIILIIAPVYSGEYDGMDHIILTSRYGRTKCATAKVVASLLSSFLITLLVVAVNLTFAWFVYGKDGLNASILFAPIEFSEGYIPFNLTYGTLLKYQMLLAFLSAISVTGMTLILSALFKKPLLSFVSSATLYIIPLILPIVETNSLYRLLVLMPLYYSQYISLLSVEQLDNNWLYALWAIPVAIILTFIGAYFSRRIFARHQIL